MARVKRHFLPERVWHITHRRRKREFLLKFARDRRSWISRLFEANKRYKLQILNYVATSQAFTTETIDNPAATQWLLRGATVRS